MKKSVLSFAISLCILFSAVPVYASFWDLFSLDTLGTLTWTWKPARVKEYKFDPDSHVYVLTTTVSPDGGDDAFNMAVYFQCVWEDGKYQEIAVFKPEKDNEVSVCISGKSAHDPLLTNSVVTDLMISQPNGKSEISRKNSIIMDYLANPLSHSIYSLPADKKEKLNSAWKDYNKIHIEGRKTPEFVYPQEGQRYSDRKVPISIVDHGISPENIVFDVQWKGFENDSRWIEFTNYEKKTPVNFEQTSNSFFHLDLPQNIIGHYRMRIKAKGAIAWGPWRTIEVKYPIPPEFVYPKEGQLFNSRAADIKIKNDNKKVVFDVQWKSPAQDSKWVELTDYEVVTDRQHSNRSVCVLKMYFPENKIGQYRLRVKEEGTNNWSPWRTIEVKHAIKIDR